jgi:hypothetical protein
MKLFYKPLLLLLFLFVHFTALPESDPSMVRFTISGHIKDSQTGEDLIGATVYINEITSGTISNEYGFYSISIPKGEYTFRFSYIGFKPVTHKLKVEKNLTFNIELVPAPKILDEVEVMAEKGNANVSQPEMSVDRMDIKTIQKIPALMGEVDIIKALQLLPGVQSTSEGSSGFSVRGGSTDQNLILLDEATVYNPSHLLGFFSIFNNDAIKDVKLYKGDLPAQYGGRLSSVLDVRMKDGNLKQFSGTGGIGLIASRLMLEGPILKDRTSFLVAGRRTYADLFLPLSRNENVKTSKLYFYDFNAKLNHMFNENNRLYLSGYFGRDVFKNRFAYMKLGNATGTVRWNHLFSKKLFSNFTTIYSHYNYNLGSEQNNQPSSFVWLSGLEDLGLIADFTWFLNTDNKLRFGASSTYHTFEPGSAKGKGDVSLFTDFLLPKEHALESAIYLSNEQNIGSLLTLKYGVRFSMFQNVGPALVYHYDANFKVDDSTNYGRGEFYNTYFGFEPRIGIMYILNEKSSVKASYSRTNQYLQLAQNSTAGTPLDIWYPASPNVKPQIADQFALGYFRNFMKNKIETSVEVYYKSMQNTIDFKDFANLLLNKYLEGELRFGKAWSYGIELLVRIPEGRLNGWIAYTYSRTLRQIPEINSGNKYPAPYDVPNNIAVVVNYEISPRLSVSANWVYGTGKPVTFPTGRAVIDGAIVPIYSNRNEYRMRDYHRLDLSLTLRGKPKARKFHGEWVFSVYNAYDRHNTWAINFVQDQNNPNVTYAEQTYLFGIIPSITYNFSF